MRLKVLLPSRVLVDQEVVKVIAEAADGSFCLLPRHQDLAAALAPGLLAYESAAGGETFLALDEGALVKSGDQVLVSTRNAVEGRDLGTLRRALEEEFSVRDELERKSRAAVSRMEADVIRRFLELKDRA